MVVDHSWSFLGSDFKIGVGGLSFSVPLSAFWKSWQYWWENLRQNQYHGRNDSTKVVGCEMLWDGKRPFEKALKFQLLSFRSSPALRSRWRWSLLCKSCNTVENSAQMGVMKMTRVMPRLWRYRDIMALFWQGWIWRWCIHRQRRQLNTSKSILGLRDLSWACRGRRKLWGRTSLRSNQPAENDADY